MSTAIMSSMKHVPTWDGEKTTFTVWWNRFEAFAEMTGFSDALEESIKTKLPTKKGVYDSDPVIKNEQEDATAINDVAIWAFTTAFQASRTWSMMFEARSKDWPKGIAWKIAKKLKTDNQPTDRMALVDYRLMVSKITMKESDEPKVLFEKIAEIRNMFQDASFDITEQDMIGIVMDKAALKYNMAIANAQTSRGDALNMEDLLLAMNNFYRMECKRGASENKNDEVKNNEVTVTSVDENKSTGIKCYKCGESGHKAYQCTRSDDTQKFTGTCDHCGKHGHRKIDCWDLPENAHKRPKYYKVKEAKEAGAMCIEVLLSSIDMCVPCVDSIREFPENFDILKDKNIWIGDTGATTHLTFCDEGLTSVLDVNQREAIIVGNG